MAKIIKKIIKSKQAKAPEVKKVEAEENGTYLKTKCHHYRKVAEGKYISVFHMTGEASIWTITAPVQSGPSGPPVPCTREEYEANWRIAMGMLEERGRS